MRHLSTKKHLLKNQPDSIEPLICECGKEYRFLSGLSKHKLICSNLHAMSSQLTILEQINSINEPENLKQLVCDIVVKNIELQNSVIQQKNFVIEQQADHYNEMKSMNAMYQDKLDKLIPKIGTTNTFNLQVFLNEDCKNAMNMSEFIKSIKVMPADLDKTRELGLIESVKSQLLTNLNQLKFEDRPIHCTDPIKRELYVKDNNEWNKDANNNKIKSSIVTVAHNQMRGIVEWEKINTEWSQSIKGMEEYSNMVTKLTKKVNVDAKGIRNIIDEVTLATKLAI